MTALIVLPSDSIVFTLSDLQSEQGKDANLSIDPHMLFEQSRPSQPSISASAMPEDDSSAASPPAVTPSSDKSSSGSAVSSNKKPVSTGRRTRSSASKAQQHSQAQHHKSVADLALPMPDAGPQRKPVFGHPSQANKQQPPARPFNEADEAAEEADAGHHHLPHIVFPVPDYIDRPSAEEYSKLSSKEKRQLRNKISARNFRHRRKGAFSMVLSVSVYQVLRWLNTEYITTLEEEIATRDDKIVSLEEEMSSLRGENSSMRNDLTLLRKTVDELLDNARPSPAGGQTASPAPQSSTAANTILTPNMSKDKSIYGSAFGPGGHNPLGSLDVHTLFVPEPSPSAFASAARRNINPRLNNVLPPSADQKAHLAGQQPLDNSFMASNPYLFGPDHLDKYRASLYSKLTQNINGAKADPLNFQPTYFAANNSSSGSYSSRGGNNSLKHGSPAQEAVPSSPLRTDGDVEEEVHGAAAAQTARVASIASTSLLSSMFSTFVSTFLGSSPQQTADLMTGRSELRVVPSGQPRSAQQDDSHASAAPAVRRSSVPDVDHLEADLSTLRVHDDSHRLRSTKHL